MMATGKSGYVRQSGHVVCYAPTWVVFLPNILVDAKRGLMWTVHLKLKRNNTLASAFISLRLLSSVYKNKPFKLWVMSSGP
jgi:hypothetical protein